MGRRKKEQEMTGITGELTTNFIKEEPKLEPKVEFILIYTPQGKLKVDKFLDAWPALITGIETLIESSAGDLSKGIVLNDILYGNSLLWLCFVDSKYAGFITTNCQYLLDAKKYLTIKQLYIKKGTALSLFLQGKKKLIEYGKLMGCDAMRMVTKSLIERKALENSGWTETYREYEYNLKEV